MESSAFQTMWDNFPDLKIKPLGEKIGGKVKENIDSGVFHNGCAIRASYSLNAANFKIPFTTGKTSSGFQDGTKRWYFYRVKDLEAFVSSSLSGTKISKSQLPDLHSKLANQTGLVIFHQQFSDATGHAALWNGKTFRGKNDDYSKSADSATFYPIK